jgi:biotin transport system substrate-specific component
VAARKRILQTGIFLPDGGSAGVPIAACCTNRCDVFWEPGRLEPAGPARKAQNMTSRRTSARAAKRRLSARDLALIASFAALIAVLGLPGSIHLFGNAVPVTLQTLGVMLAGSILGWKRGALSVLVLLVLVAAGMPLLSGGRGGLAVFAGPSAGYLVGWVLGAAVIGWLVQRRLPAYPRWWGATANIVGGIGAVYLVGIPVQAAVLGTSGLVATATSAALFLPGDLVKVVIATAVASAVYRGYPGITAPSSATSRERVATR